MLRMYISLSVMLFLFCGCLSSTPFQSARVAERGEEGMTLAVQRSVIEDGGRNANWFMGEMTGRIPIIPGWVEGSINGALVVFGTDSMGGMFGLGVKCELLKDLLAIDVPARIMLGGELETTHFYPRAILSLPIGKNVELNLSTTRIYYASDTNVNGPVGYAVGLALGQRGRLIIRPEVGVLVYESGQRTFQFGIALTPGLQSSKPQGNPTGTPF